VGGDTHGLLEAHELILESLVAAHELLDGLVARLLATEVIELLLETLNVLLCAGANSALGLTVICALASEL
jgi:hypothetical protein